MCGRRLPALVCTFAPGVGSIWSWCVHCMAWRGAALSQLGFLGGRSKAVAAPAEQEAVDEAQHNITTSVSTPSEAAGDSTKKVR